MFHLSLYVTPFAGPAGQVALAERPCAADLDRSACSAWAQVEPECDALPAADRNHVAERFVSEPSVGTSRPFHGNGSIFSKLRRLAPSKSQND